jgi:nucleoside-diphosphate-sugar epimerase
MRIVVTGASGYIGARLCKNLAEIGHEIVAVYRKIGPKGENWKNKLYGIIEGDIREDGTIKMIANSGAEAVVHLVSLDHRQSEADPVIVNEINVLPIWRLLDECRKSTVSKFIYFSTMQVYGKLPAKLIDEKFPLNAVNTYGLTHLLSEQIASYYNSNSKLNVISVRLSNSYGTPVFDDNNCWWLAINDLCKSAFEKKEIRLLSDGSPQRDFIHGNDVVNAIKLILEKADKSEENVYHISSGKTKSILELALTIQSEYFKMYNQEIPIFTPNGLFSKSDYIKPNSFFHLSNEKIKEIGYSPMVSLEEGIQELFTYCENKNLDATS